MKHTEGPWRVFVDNRTDGDGYTYVAGLNIESDAGEVVGCEGIEAWKDNAEANARLIAAAPELLAAAECDAALDMTPDVGWPILERHGWDRDSRFDLPATEFVRRLRGAAIARATGEPA